MAAITKQETSGGTHLHSWTLTQADNNGEAGSNSGAADRTVQVIGTFGGATVTIKGSNELNNPTNWGTLHDFAGAAISFTGDGIAVLAENPLHIAPFVTGGDGTTSIQVLLLSRSRP